MLRPSVVIRCFNEEAHIGRLLDGIMHQTIGDVDVVVVDSGSIDGTLDVVRQYPARVVTIEPREFSFGRSLNAGCRAATGEIVIIASAHTYPVYDDWLAQLLRPFADPRVALAYGRQRGEETTKYSERQIFASWFPTRSDFDQRHPFANNGNAAIRRSVWAQMPYDEELTGLEDLDWAKRILALGHRLAYVAEAEVIHVHNESWMQVFTRYRREAIALKRIYPHERFGILDFVRLFAGNVAADWGHARHDGVLTENWLAVPLFRLMQFWGTFRGFAHRGAIPGELKQTFYYPRRRRTDAPAARAPDGRPIDYDRIPRKNTSG